MNTLPQDPVIPSELYGQWVAWDRKTAQIIASGDSFEAAKRDAAKAGYREVVIGKADSHKNWGRHKHLLWMAVVFIAQAADSLGDLTDLLSS